ncbi:MULTISPECIES: hypothetical protein [unclassified Rhizobium]|uniref:hypothetical protein n=1 Tax=Rhizobium sp. PP-CC-3G-465 TaxID=2135648 RepID=UPI00140433DA
MRLPIYEKARASKPEDDSGGDAPHGVFTIYSASDTGSEIRSLGVYKDQKLFMRSVTR